MKLVMNVLDESDRPISYRNPLPQFIAKKVPTLSHHSASLQQRLHFTARQHPWMLYGLSPPAKRKYSNLKQLVGWQIVKRNKKKVHSRCHLRQMNNCNARGLKRGLSLGQSDLEWLRTYWEHNRHIHATESGWGQSAYPRVVSAFYYCENSCVEVQLSGGYTPIIWRKAFPGYQSHFFVLVMTHLSLTTEGI